MNDSEYVKKWRKNTKKRIIESMGGKCQICGYDKCPEAMDLHHLIPEEKEISFGKITANPRAWESIIVPELRKCILLCSNCHREFHAGYVNLPNSFESFNEDYVNYKNMVEDTPCKICGKLKNAKQIYCSQTCQNKARNSYDWENIDLQSMIDEGRSAISIAKEIGCSDTIVRRKLRKLGLKTIYEK